MLYREMLQAKQAEQTEQAKQSANRALDRAKLDSLFIDQLLKKPSSFGRIEVSKTDYNNFQEIFSKVLAEQSEHNCNVFLVICFLFTTCPFLLYAFNVVFKIFTIEQLNFLIENLLILFLLKLAYVLWRIFKVHKLGEVHTLTINGESAVYYYLYRTDLKICRKSYMKSVKL